jgi:NTE family protein
VKRWANLQKTKIGLALGGGVARGAAHIGVLEVLQNEGIAIDMIAGTSAGAIAGAIYAQANDATRMKNLVLDLNRKSMASLVDLTLPKTGFVKGKKITDFLRTIMGGDIEFADLKIPFACVATDVLACEEVVIKEGSVLEGIRASISIPGVLTPARWKGRYLVDGALINPVPVSVVREMGADFVIAVNVSPDRHERAQQIAKKDTKGAKSPNIFSIIMESMQIAGCLLARSCLEGADIVVTPQLAHIGSTDFHQARACILQGQRAAQDCMPEIKRRLEIRYPKTRQPVRWSPKRLIKRFSRHDLRDGIHIWRS